MLVRLRKKTQSVAEYAVLLSVVVAAVVAIQGPLKRFLDAKYLGAMKYFNRETENVLGGDVGWEPTDADTRYTTYTSFQNMTESPYAHNGTTFDEYYKNIMSEANIVYTATERK